MKVNHDGLVFLEKEEGCVLHIYKDQAGKDTIGIGHLITNAEKVNEFIKLPDRKVFFKRPITRSDALDILANDLKDREEVVSMLVKVALGQNQFNAVMSLVFNIGCNAFANSSVLREINSYNYPAVPKAFRMWNKITVDGKLVVCPDLKVRREREIKLWEKKDA